MLFSEDFGGKQIILDIGSQKSNEKDRIQQLAKNERHSVWTKVDMAKLYHLELIKLDEKRRRFEEQEKNSSELDSLQGQSFPHLDSN